LQLQVFLYPDEELKFKKRNLNNDLTFIHFHKKRKKYIITKGVDERDITIELP
jgi:hypothetical protein